MGYAASSTADLGKVAWFYRHVSYRFSREQFEQGDRAQGERGAPQFWVPKSPFQTLVQRWMRYEDLIAALYDTPDAVEEVFRAMDESYDSLYESLEDFARKGGSAIINFGENIHGRMTPPAIFEPWLRPFFEKRSGQLRRAGFFTHIHMDGDLRPLLGLLRDMPFDGLEALTPEPQGDVSLEEIKEAIGGKVLLDGIPAIYFLSHYPAEALQECVERITALFGPRLILGVSDELPMAAGREGLDRLHWVANWTRRKREEALSRMPGALSEFSDMRQ